MQLPETVRRLRLGASRPRRAVCMRDPREPSGRGTGKGPSARADDPGEALTDQYVSADPYVLTDQYMRASAISLCQ